MNRMMNLFSKMVNLFSKHLMRLECPVEMEVSGGVFGLLRLIENTRVGCHFHLQEIFMIQGLNLCLLFGM